MIDYSFIKELEGNARKAYIPKENGKIIGQSGVTIAKGLDLGNFGELDKLNISECLRDKLDRYSGLRRECAEQMLKDYPLKLSARETDELNKAIIEYHSRFIEEIFNNHSSKKWEEIPDALQTVIASVLHQYGNPHRVPNFWRYSINVDIQSVIKELRDFGDNFPTRRNREADYLERNYA